MEDPHHPEAAATSIELRKDEIVGRPSNAKRIRKTSSIQLTHTEFRNLRKILGAAELVAHTMGGRHTTESTTAATTFNKTLILSRNNQRKKKVVIIDIEAFQWGETQFHLKELAYCVVDEMVSKQYTFRYPSSMFASFGPAQKRAYNWYTLNLHGIFWTQGGISHLNINIIIKCDPVLGFGEDRDGGGGYSFWCKGLQKSQFLSHLLKKEVYNLETIDCPIINKPQNILKCDITHHDSSFIHCALRKAIVYA
jgi:hypothetical protein